MVQRSEQLRLAMEPRDPLGIVREALGDDLQRDVTSESCIARAIHFAHAARTPLGEDFVGSEPRTGTRDHECVGRRRAHSTWLSCAAEAQIGRALL